ncbi:hypothetical protein GUJ93_ZPchr0015g6954 [Zizania palustris]|uniref:Zinc finger C3HC4 RING-type domain-containing protein n=1 Tax=Zizania palustris TaxID=103762 RepID=A0A8J5VSZ2_ZIZPA|nr:hypothetical protein GUJ93_ZPchr0015g6954 [Zizania palustris]
MLLFAIIYPFLQQLEGNLMEKECKEKGWCKETASGGRKLYATDEDDEREGEYDIFLETCPKMVLPNCNHAMCINCLPRLVIAPHSFLLIHRDAFSY